MSSKFKSSVKKNPEKTVSLCNKGMTLTEIRCAITTNQAAVVVKPPEKIRRRMRRANGDFN